MLAALPSTGGTYDGDSVEATPEELKPAGALHAGGFLASQAALAASSADIMALTELTRPRARWLTGGALMSQAGVATKRESMEVWARAGECRRRRVETV